MTGSGHQSPGLWRHPDDQSWRFDSTEHWVELAKTLEEAKFHGIFIADVLGKIDSPLPPSPHLHPWSSPLFVELSVLYPEGRILDSVSFDLQPLTLAFSHRWI